MHYALISVVILVVLVVLTQFFSGKEKPSGGSCQNCPEYSYCGGGRPRCPRRAERKK